MKQLAGTPAALSFATIYAQNVGFVSLAVRRSGVKREALDDVVQEVFMVVHCKLATLESPAVLRSWLYGIVRRKVWEFRRKELAGQSASALRPEHLGDVMLTQAAPDGVEERVSARQHLALLRLVEPVKRQVLLMAKLDELTCPEIAESLNIPVSTAYSRLRHAREELEAAMSLCDEPRAAMQ